MTTKKIILVVDNRVQPNVNDFSESKEPKNQLKGSGFKGIYFLIKQLKSMLSMRQNETPISQETIHS